MPFGKAPADGAVPLAEKDRGSFDAGAELFGKRSPAERDAADVLLAGGDEAPADSEGEATYVAGAAACSFVASVAFVRGESAGFGLDVTQSDFLRINRIDTTGPIAAYNAAAPDPLRIWTGDFIGGVAGRRGHARPKLAALEAGGMLELEIRRPLVFLVAGLDKSKGNLGLEAIFYARSTVALIRRVLPQGLLDEHNQRFPELAVRPGDFLVAVNGQRGTSRELVHWLTASEEPELTISRPEGA